MVIFCHIHQVTRHTCFTLGTRAIFCLVILNSSRRIFIKPSGQFLLLLSWVLVETLKINMLKLN